MGVIRLTVMSVITLCGGIGLFLYGMKLLSSSLERIAGAGLDTLSPEPVPAGHPLTALPPEVQRKVVLAPHLGGITEASFRRAHAHMWRNVEHLAAGERPDNIVNGL